MRAHELNLLEQLYAEFRTAVRAGVGLECDVFKQKVVEYHRQMNQPLAQIEVTHQLFGSIATTVHDVGVYNGLEYAMHILEDRCVDYRDVPDIHMGLTSFLPSCRHGTCAARVSDASEVTETAP